MEQRDYDYITPTPCPITDDNVFTEEELRALVAKIKSIEAPGKDGIKGKVVKAKRRKPNNFTQRCQR